MTRKDYVRLAAALHSSMPMVNERADSRHGQWQKDVAAIGAVLAADNAAFHFERFLAACEDGP